MTSELQKAAIAYGLAISNFSGNDFDRFLPQQDFIKGALCLLGQAEKYEENMMCVNEEAIGVFDYLREFCEKESNDR